MAKNPMMFQVTFQGPEIYRFESVLCPREFFSDVEKKCFCEAYFIYRGGLDRSCANICQQITLLQSLFVPVSASGALESQFRTEPDCTAETAVSLEAAAKSSPSSPYHHVLSSKEPEELRELPR